MITMVPEAWQNDVTMTKDKKAFYKWSSFVMEPWDGPGRVYLHLSPVLGHLFSDRNFLLADWLGLRNDKTGDL